MTTSIRDICSLSPVVPVIEIVDAALAVSLARALLAGGLPVMEITLRTPAALDAITAASSVGGMMVGAGTLLNPTDVQQAKKAGAMFGVSPGSTKELIDATADVDMPFLPGAATPSEAINLAQKGFNIQKFFPAEAAGGTSMLKSLASPLKDVEFCPTGGVSRDNVSAYLSLPNVICTGGSWVATPKQISDQDWNSIEENARYAATLNQ